jgi:uncharacterized membrane protein
MESTMTLDFINDGSLLWGSTIIALILLFILTIVLFVGWKVNNKSPKNVKVPVLILKEEYHKENFPEKEYIGIKKVS